MEHDDIMHNAAPGMILALASLLSFVLNISTKQSLLDLNNILSRKPQRTSALLHSTAAAVSERENAAQVSAVHALWQLLCHYDTLWKCLRYHASSQLQTFTTKRVHGMQVTVPLTSVCVCVEGVWLIKKINTGSSTGSPAYFSRIGITKPISLGATRYGKIISDKLTTLFILF